MALENGHICVWILGLNHAGTTIVWRAFREDSQFLCFDEPLTASVGFHFPDNNEKKTFDEYIQYFGSSPKDFWRIYEPMYPLQELNAELNQRQREYLTVLVQQAPKVVIDETHLHRHLHSISDMTPDGNFIHLYRRASAFVTSHLRPSLSASNNWLRRLVRTIRSEYNRSVFWERRSFLPGMARGEVIGHHPNSKFGELLSAEGYDVERIMASPILVRLLAYWHYQYHWVEHYGPRVCGTRFTSLRYEDFATRPQKTMTRLYEWMGLPPPAMQQYPNVHPPKPPFRPNDKRWLEAARIAGFSEDEIETLL